MAPCTLLLVVLLQGPSTGDVAAATEAAAPADVAAALNAAYEQWLADVEFHGDYTLEKGFTADEAQATQGVIDRALVWDDGVRYVCRGVIVKTRDELRVSGEYGAPPLRKANDRTTRMAFDEVRTRVLRATHSPAGVRREEDSRRRGSLIVTPRADGDVNLADQYAAGPASRTQISPLSIFGGEVRLPCVLNVKAGVPFETQVRPLSPERLEITLLRSGDSTRRRVVVWRTDFSPPVVESIRETFDWPAQDVRTVHAGYASQFVACRGGAVASHVVETIWDSQQPERWQVRRWLSENITSDLSGQELTVELAPATQVGGLTAPPDVTQSSAAIDLSQIGPDDLRKPRTPLPSSSKPLTRNENSQTRWLILAVNCLLFAGLAVAYLRRRWRKKVEPESR